MRGDRRTDVEPLLQPLSDAGFAWFSIDYRLMTDVTRFGVAIDDVESAIGFVKANAGGYGVDGSRIALIGESAGGQLAAMAVLNGPRDPAIKAVVGLYTPSDLAVLVNKNCQALPPWILEHVRATPWEGLIRARLKQLSPIEHLRRDMPPFLLIHGTADPLVPFQQSVDLCNRMRAAGASCDLFPVAGAGHGMRWWQTSDVATCQREMVRWLKQRLD